MTLLMKPAHVVRWLNHLGAMCSRAWRAQHAAGPEFSPSRGLARRVRLRKRIYLNILPMHMMIREIIPGRQRRARWCPV